MKLDNIIAHRSNKTIYRDGEKSIKVFNLNYPKTDILGEALNQARLEATPLNTPRLLEVLKIDGRWSIVSEYIGGKTLGSLMHDNPERYDEYLRIFVELQLLVNEQKVDDLNTLTEKMTRRIPKTELPAGRKAELMELLASMPVGDRVCHGDFSPGNIIIAAYGTPYIIDWSHVTQGDPAADAALTFLRFVTANERDHAEKYLDVYSELSGVDREYICRWIPLVAATQSVKGTPEIREELLNWAM